jgi:hypothetical protein
LHLSSSILRWIPKERMLKGVKAEIVQPIAAQCKSSLWTQYQKIKMQQHDTENWTETLQKHFHLCQNYYESTTHLEGAPRSAPFLSTTYLA